LPVFCLLAVDNLWIGWGMLWIKETGTTQQGNYAENGATAL